MPPGGMPGSRASPLPGAPHGTWREAHRLRNPGSMAPCSQAPRLSDHFASSDPLRWGAFGAPLAWHPLRGALRSLTTADGCSAGALAPGLGCAHYPLILPTSRCPEELEPQAQTEPSLRSAREWEAPAARALML